MNEVEYRYKSGEKVIIKSTLKDGFIYNKTIGKIGTVSRNAPVSHNSVGIDFEDIKNPSSSTGTFWYDLSEIKKYEKENNMIKLSAEVLKEMGVEAIVSVDVERKHECFISYEKLEAGDVVLVESNNNTYSVGTVEYIVAEIEHCTYSTKEVICKCDISNYTDRKDKIRRKKEIKEKMDKRIKELQTEKIYEMFAENDDDLKNLLNEYKEI